MTDQKILDNAPEGATHIDHLFSYWLVKDRDAFNWHGTGWQLISSDAEDFRSLADIKRIAELEGFNVGLAEESCAQQKRIAELEKALIGMEDTANNFNERIAELEKERDDFETLNSELYSIIFTHLGWWELEGVNEIDHDDIIKALKEQAK